MAVREALRAKPSLWLCECVSTGYGRAAAVRTQQWLRERPMAAGVPAAVVTEATTVSDGSSPDGPPFGERRSLRSRRGHGVAQPP